MTQPRASWPARFLQLFDSPKVFWITFGWFILAALWIALSGAYSMAFDEYVHFGTIQLYAQQWSPFISTQPLSADAFGAITRDPSYLHHYLLSFPYRLFAHFIHTFVAQVIFLRLLDISFFAGGILFFRAALQQVGFSTKVVNLSLGFLLLMPVVPFMAAQINYDNLLFLFAGASIWLAVKIDLQLRRHKRLPISLLLWLITVMSLASITKYAYLPILIAIVSYFAVLSWRLQLLRPQALAIAWQTMFQSMARWKLIGLLLLSLLSAGLFMERYVVNTLRYHSPTPECNQVLALERCMAYEPFARNYNYHQGNYELPTRKIWAYPFNNWIRGMLRSQFHVVSSKTVNGYTGGEPFLLTHIAGFLVLVGGLVAVVLRQGWLWRCNSFNRLALVTCAVYAGLLFLQNFMDFLHVHVPVAIQGRYLIPIMPLFLVLVVQVYSNFLSKLTRPIKATILAIVCVMLLQGGSLLPFVLRQDDSYIWNAPLVRNLNHAAQDVLRPVIISHEVWIFD